MSCAPSRELGLYPQDRPRIGQRRRADLNRVRTSEEHSHRSQPVAHTADAYDACVGERRPAVVDRTQGDAVECVSGEPPAPSSEDRCPPFGVDGDSKQGVRQRERLSTRRERSLSDREDIGCVRRELGPTWSEAGCRRLHGRACRRRRVSEHTASVLEVRAADVDLDGDHARRSLRQQ